MDNIPVRPLNVITDFGPTFNSHEWRLKTHIEKEITALETSQQLESWLPVCRTDINTFNKLFKPKTKTFKKEEEKI